jgi:aldose 1-epimerase
MTNCIFLKPQFGGGPVMKKFILVCLSVFFLFFVAACRTGRKEQPFMAQAVFGRLPDGREVIQYTLANRAGLTANIINYGATLTSLRVPNRNGKMEDVVLGYDSVQGYMDGTAYFGAIVGRYGNRIGKGQFKLDGEHYQLAVNDGENHLHGGTVGFNKVLWDARILADSAEPSIQLQYVSRDGEEGYPGTVTLKVVYTLTGNFTNTILDHLLTIEADEFTPVDQGLIPTGEIRSVANTPMDFRTSAAIGARIEDPYEQLTFGHGYDHNWVLRGSAGKVRKAAEVYEPASGRLMTVFTDQPGLQFYSGNFLDGTEKGKNGIAYPRRSGFCLEAQAFPDTPNKPQFPPVTLRPGQVYRQTTIYQFSTR